MKVKEEKNGKIKIIAENKKDSNNLFEFLKKIAEKVEEKEAKNER